MKLSKEEVKIIIQAIGNDGHGLYDPKVLDGVNEEFVKAMTHTYNSDLSSPKSTPAPRLFRNGWRHRMEIKYPHIKVRLTGTDGNAFMIIGKVVQALRRANVSPFEVSQFKEEAMSGDYDNVLQTCMKWVDVE